MTMQEKLNAFMDMDKDECENAIKSMTPEERAEIINLMCLPKRCSQKRLCSEIEETKRFLKIARSGNKFG